MLLRKLARPLLGSAFIASGVDALRSPTESAHAVQPVLDAGREAVPNGVPADAETIIKVTGAVQVGAGAALALGKAPRIASTILAGSLIPSTVYETDFWNETDPALRSAKRAAFTKNVGLLGGVLIASADTEGKPSLAWRGRRRIGDARENVAGALPFGASNSSGSDFAETSAQLAETTRHRAAELSTTVSERAPEVLDTVRSRANKLAGEVADRAPEVAATARDRANKLAGEVADRAPDAAAQARGRANKLAGEVADRAPDVAAQARGRANKLAGELADRAPDAAAQARGRANKLADQLADRAPDAAAKARGRAVQAGDQAARRTRRLRSRAAN
ncbi:DoxX family membrane protein [Gordonia zhaorongruii]|uniref:DoxX family membrane protein n=1 Tax=Gordonia zhaorongruii TaxID=2597659 RepID=UPI00104D9C49|nr:DoxX family membrane protein [Gordonia zhaorongruii]